MKKKKVLPAVLIMLGLVLLSLPLGANRSLTKLREKAEESYYDSGSVYDGLEARKATVSNLLAVAERYSENRPGLAAPKKELERTLQQLENCDWEDYAAEARANREMGTAAAALAEALSAAELSQRDAGYRTSLLAELQAQQTGLERSGYNEKAGAYNDALDRFPVNYLRHLAFLEPMPLY